MALFLHVHIILFTAYKMKAKCLLNDLINDLECLNVHYRIIVTSGKIDAEA